MQGSDSFTASLGSRQCTPQRIEIGPNAVSIAAGSRYPPWPGEHETLSKVAAASYGKYRLNRRITSCCALHCAYSFSRP